MIKEAIVKIVSKEDLTYQEAYTVMNEIMGGETTPTQNAAFLAALSTKSAKAETTDEIAGCAAAMRDHAVKVDTGMDIFEIVGTGGDNAHSFNISTTSALVAAGFLIYHLVIQKHTPEELYVNRMKRKAEGAEAPRPQTFHDEEEQHGSDSD